MSVLILHHFHVFVTAREESFYILDILLENKSLSVKGQTLLSAAAVC
jgi:hypothetical protein